jgi:basic membrane protein A and related proteins
MTYFPRASRRFSLFLSALVCWLAHSQSWAQAPTSVPAPATKSAPLKVGYVFVSPVSDAGWTHQHNLARQQLEKELGSRVTTTFVEKVSEGPDAERVIRDLATQGHQLIFTTSFGYMNPTEKIAAQFPSTVFMHATGYKTAPNMGNYNARFYEGRFLNGFLAGKMSKSGVVGYVAAFPIPEVLQGINAFARGLRIANPKAQVRVVWVNSWYDPAKEREAAVALLNQSADVLTNHTDSSAVIQAAEQRGVFSIGYHSDMSKFAPKGQLTATTHHWGAHNISVAKAVLEKRWVASSVWGGMKDGFIQLAPINPVVPAAVVAQLKALEADLIAGKLHPFSGPLLGQDGKELIPAGRTLTDVELNSMDYYLWGVSSKLPKK